MTGTGPLSFDAYIKDTNFKAQIDAMERRILGLTTTAVQKTSEIDDSFRRLGQTAAGVFVFSKLSDLPAQLIKVRGEFQQLEIAFTTLLGTKAKADAFLKQGVDFAATTPFQLDEVARAQKIMLAYGFSVQSVIPTLTKLGDIAAGTGSSLQELVLAYGQIKTQGTAQQDDINKFIERGVNLIPELAKQFKVADGEVKKLVADGKVGFADVEKAITSLTDGTSNLNFGGLMAEQAKSLTGLTSNLADAWDSMLNQIGKDNQDLLASAIQGATGIVQNYEPVLDILKVLVASYGAYKTAVIATTVVQAAANVAGNVRAWLSLATTIRSAKDAQIAFNLATSANPYAVVATLLVGLITAVSLYKKELTSAQQAEEDIKEARKQAADDASTEIAKIQLLKTAITNEKLSRDARNKALRELIALSPEHLSALTLENVKTGEGTTAINTYVEALKRKLEIQRLDAKLAESLKRQSDAERGDSGGASFLDKLSAASASSAGEGSFDYNKAVADASKRNRDQIVRDEKAIQDSIFAEKKALDEAGQATATNEVKKQKVRAVTIEQIEAEIKALKESLSLNNSDAQNARTRKQIEDLEKQRRRLTGEKTKAEKDADKVGPFGSISYYEAISRKADEIIAKTSKTDTATLQKQNSIKLEAERQAEEIRKKLAIKSFDEELSDKRQKFELYQKWVDAYGKQAADTQFSDLLKTGRSFVDYLNAQIEQLENQRDNVGLTDKESGNLAALFSERDQIKGQKSAIDAFTDSLASAQQQAGGLAEYLTLLKAKQDELSTRQPVTKDDFDIRRRLAEETVQTEAALKDQLNQFLESYASSSQQQLAIQSKYIDLRKGLEKQYNGQKTEGYQRALAIIDTAEKQDFKEFQQRKLEETGEYKKTTQVIIEEGRKGLKIQLDNQQKVVDKAKELFGVNSDAYKKAKKDLDGLAKAFSEDTLGQIAQYAGHVGQLGQALSALGGNAGQAGDILVALSQNVVLISSAFKKGITDSEKFGIAIQGITNVITAIASAAAQRKKAETDYYNSVIAQQSQYNLLLNEQLGIQTKSKENIFVKDYVGELEDGFDKYNDAQSKYQDALKKLQQGQAKAGLKTVDDKAAGLQIIGSSAAVGAAIGSIIPGVGTVIGGVVGAIGGALSTLFGGSKKKADEFGSLLGLYPDLIKKSATGVDELNTALAESLIQQNLVDDSTKQTLQSTIDWQKQMDEAKAQIKEIVSTLAGNLGDKLRDSLVGAFEAGTDSAKAFSSDVSAILEDMVTKILFSKAFNSLFDSLEKDLTNSLNVAGGGDGSVIDDFQRFTENSQGALAQFNQWLAQFKDAAKQSGFDVLQNPNSSSNSLATQGTRAVQGVSQETAGLISGQLNAMRITQVDTNSICRQQLLSLSNIDRNTGKATDLLDSIDRRLKNIESDPLRGMGVGPK